MSGGVGMGSKNDRGGRATKGSIGICSATVCGVGRGPSIACVCASATSHTSTRGNDPLLPNPRTENGAPTLRPTTPSLDPSFPSAFKPLKPPSLPSAKEFFPSETSETSETGPPGVRMAGGFINPACPSAPIPAPEGADMCRMNAFAFSFGRGDHERGAWRAGGCMWFGWAIEYSEYRACALSIIRARISGYLGRRIERTLLGSSKTSHAVVARTVHICGICLSSATSPKKSIGPSVSTTFPLSSTHSAPPLKMKYMMCPASPPFTITVPAGTSFALKLSASMLTNPTSHSWNIEPVPSEVPVCCPSPSSCVPGTLAPCFIACNFLYSANLSSATFLMLCATEGKSLKTSSKSSFRKRKQMHFVAATMVAVRGTLKRIATSPKNLPSPRRAYMVSPSSDMTSTMPLYMKYMARPTSPYLIIGGSVGLYSLGLYFCTSLCRNSLFVP
eukprot:comp20729_c0_seq1/m.27094 comp20729_c0_seq1/g.27094  ORF comp20729_c0_seq1/g.27094 comp20729_c0_seq1/m.27094 type:complete len:446 (+) comp20729_c0_seq1:915-2252(+)